MQNVLSKWKSYLHNFGIKKILGILTDEDLIENTKTTTHILSVA